MITLVDFQKYEALGQELKAFFIEKCKEYEWAKTNGFVDSRYLNLDKQFETWVFKGLYVDVIFRREATKEWEIDDVYTYTLPLDLLFDPGFKLKMKVRFEEEREKERQGLLEKRKQHDEELKQVAEHKRVKEVEILRELMRKYPEEVENADV